MMPSFRLGTTSYIIPDDILPNVRFLADKVQDIQLVLFEVDDGPSNLPAPGVVAALSALAEAAGLTYTVHLPLDLRLGSEGDLLDVSLVKAKRVIDCTLPLDPWAFVLHLDGRDLRLDGTGDADSEHVRAWQLRCAQALGMVAEWAGGPERLAVENLERYPPAFILPILDVAPVSLCVDVGHLWLSSADALPYLRLALPRTRVVHLHGIGERDHKSLSLVPSGQLNPVVEYLVRADYRGVVTLEVFSEADFYSSKEAIAQALREVCGRRRSG